MAVTFRDYYETLGVPRDADEKKIKAAYIYYNIKKDGWMRGGAFCEKPGLT